MVDELLCNAVLSFLVLSVARRNRKNSHDNMKKKKKKKDLPSCFWFFFI